MRTLMSGCGTHDGEQLFQQEERWVFCVKRHEIRVAQKVRWHMGQLTKPTEILFNMHTCIVCVYTCI